MSKAKAAMEAPNIMKASCVCSTLKKYFHVRVGVRKCNAYGLDHQKCHIWLLLLPFKLSQATEFWFALIMIVRAKRSQIHVTLLLVQTVHLTKFICKYVHGFLSLLRQTFTVDYGVALHFYFLPHPNPRINVINPDWASAIKHPPVPPSKNMAWWYMLRGVYSFLNPGGLTLLRVA